MDKNVSKSHLARANYIFEEYVYSLIRDTRQKHATDIFRLGRNVYAFDLLGI